MAFAIGQTLQQRYQIQGILGQGGMGVVYQAYDPVLQRTVAIKVLPAQLTIDAEFVARFQREAIASANLRHPHIVTVHDVGQQDGEYFIIMEHLAGNTLEQWLAQHGPMPVAQASQVLEQIASALDYAHSRSIVHRDVKPSNIMLDAQGRAVLMDFGLVRAGEGFGPTRSTTVMGTPEYMAPEQILGQAIDRRTDIYALGVVLHELLTGKTPFRHDTPIATAYAHVHEAPPPVRTVNKAVPQPVEAVVLKALAKEPAARYQSAGDLARDFAQAAGGAMPARLAAPSPAAGSRKKPSTSPADGVQTVAMPSPGGGTPPARPGQRKVGSPLLAAGALAVVAVLLAVILWPRSGAVSNSTTPNPPAIVVASTVTDTPTQLVPLVSPTDTPRPPTDTPIPSTDTPREMRVITASVAVAPANTLQPVVPPAEPDATATARAEYGLRRATEVAELRERMTVSVQEAATARAREAPTLEARTTATARAVLTATVRARQAATATANARPRAVARSSANIRSGPGTEFPSIGSASQGEAFILTGKTASSDWFYVGKGWINTSLLEVSGDTSSLDGRHTLRALSSWRGEYFANTNLQGSPVLVREDKVLDFNWHGNSPAPGVPEDFSARWTGTLFVPAQTIFCINRDDFARVWVNGNLIYEVWTYDGGGYGRFSIGPGKHTVRIGWADTGGSASIGFKPC